MCGSPNSLLSQGQAGLGRSLVASAQVQSSRSDDGRRPVLAPEGSLQLACLWGPSGPSQLSVCVCVYKSLSYVQLFVIPWTVANQTSLSMGSSRQEYWNGLPFPSPDLPNPGIEPRSPTLQADSFPSEPSGKLTYNGESLTFQIPIFLILNSTIFNLCEEIHIFFGLPKQNSFLNGCQVQKDRNREKKNSLRTLSRAISQHFDTLPSSLFHLHF